MKTLKDFVISGKRILVRCDFNVPLDKKGNISDDFKIRQALPTIKYLVDCRAKIILMSHLDPEGTNLVDKKYNLNNVAQELGDLLNVPIKKEDDCVGPEVENQSNNLAGGEILLLENLRFHKEETALVDGHPDMDFAKKLSYLGDIYVNEAFGADHRAHASLAGVPEFLPSCAGFLLEKEINALDKVIKNPEKPMVALIGGKKVETKSKFINKISEVADFVLLGGLLEKEIKDQKIKFFQQEKIIAPVDSVKDFDIGQKTVDLFCQKISGAKTILWNGPFGKFEDKKYSKGTLALADAIIKSGGFSVVGGGETVEFLEKEGMIDKFSHVSTGGGAMLAYLAGEKMPGLEALSNAPK